MPRFLFHLLLSSFSFLSTSPFLSLSLPTYSQRILVEVWRLALDHFNGHDAQTPNINLVRERERERERERGGGRGTEGERGEIINKEEIFPSLNFYPSHTYTHTHTHTVSLSLSLFLSHLRAVLLARDHLGRHPIWRAHHGRALRGLGRKLRAKPKVSCEEERKVGRRGRWKE